MPGLIEIEGHLVTLVYGETVASEDQAGHRAGAAGMISPPKNHETTYFDHITNG